MVAGNFILLNLFISVINDGLAFVQQNPEEAEFDAAMASYLTVCPLLVTLSKFINNILKIIGGIDFFSFLCNFFPIFWCTSILYMP